MTHHVCPNSEDYILYGLYTKIFSHLALYVGGGTIVTDNCIGSIYGHGTQHRVHTFRDCVVYQTKLFRSAKLQTTQLMYAYTYVHTMVGGGN